MTCLFHAKYQMLADVMGETVVQNEYGQMERSWTTIMTISCDPRGIIGGGIRVVGSSEVWKKDFEDVEWVKMKAARKDVEDTPITKRMRVENIRRKSDGVVTWQKEVKGEIVPIQFDIVGITPFIDPFGNVTEYELLLKGETND